MAHLVLALARRADDGSATVTEEAVRRRFGEWVEILARTRYLKGEWDVGEFEAAMHEIVVLGRVPAALFPELPPFGVPQMEATLR